MRNYIQSKTFLKTPSYWYWIADNGTVTRTALNGLREERIRVTRIDGKAYVMINGKRCLLKRLVAKVFMPNYNDAYAIICKDGDEFNCRLDNLMQRSMSDVGAVTGGKARSIRIRIIYPDRTRKDCASITEAARMLYVSRSALCRYLNHKVRRSILDGYRIAPLSLKNFSDTAETAVPAYLCGFPKNEKNKL